MLNAISRSIIAVSLLVAANVGHAGADTITKIGLGNGGPDVALLNGSFGTVPDGLGGAGEQELCRLGDFSADATSLI